MSKTTKIWLITAVSLIVAGGIIFAGVMTVFKWDFKKLSTMEYVTVNHKISGEFRNISITSKTADIELIPSEGSKTSVICYEQEKVRHNVTVKDGTLVIEISDTRKWYEYIGISFVAPKITVLLPEDTYGALSVKTGTGNVKIPDNFVFENVNISGSTGNMSYYAPVSGNLRIKTSTGNIKIDDISANEFKQCDYSCTDYHLRN